MLGDNLVYIVRFVLEMIGRAMVMARNCVSFTRRTIQYLRPIILTFKGFYFYFEVIQNELDHAFERECNCANPYIS